LQPFINGKVLLAVLYASGKLSLRTALKESSSSYEFPVPIPHVNPHITSISDFRGSSKPYGELICQVASFLKDGLAKMSKTKKHPNIKMVENQVNSMPSLPTLPHM